MSISNFRLSDDRHAIDVEAQAARFDAQFPKTSAALTQVTQGLGDVGDGTFATGPKGLMQYVLGATNQLGETTEWSQVFSKYALNWRDNPVSRVGWAVGNMVYGILHLATGPETYDVRGVTQWGMSIAMLVAVPEGIKTGKMMARGAARVVPALDVALIRAEGVAALQQAAKQTLQRIRAADDAAFARAWKNTAPAGQMGALDVSWMLGAKQSTFVDAFRREAVTIADLESLVQHSDATVNAAAQQVLAERTSPIPAGCVQIPGGVFKGQAISPFAMKATSVTNGEWFQGLDGKPRYVTLEWNQKTHTVVVKDVSATPPTFLNPKLNLEAGEIATQGSQVLVKLVDNPSRGYDAAGRIFSGDQQPVVGVNYFHAQAWLQGQTLESGGKRVYGLPNDLQYEFVASNGGLFEYGTETGKLLAADGRRLAHFGEWNDGKGFTAAVDDPRYPAGPFGVQTTGNVWRWTEANPQETYPYGLRGGSWGSSFPEVLRAACRYFNSPVNRFNYVGFSPVVLPGLPK